MRRFRIFTAIMLMIIVTVCTFSGCFGEETPPPEVPLEDLYGTWVYESGDGDKTTYTFEKNMKFTKSELHSGSEAIFSMGTYSIEGNILKTKSDVGGEKTREISEFDGQRMVFGKGSVTSEYIKQKKK